MAERDGFVELVRLQMLAGPVRVECRAHRGEQVCTPPYACVHRKGNWDVMPPEQPRGRVALTSVLLALCGDRCVATCGRDAMVRVLGQCCGMHIDGGWGHESMFVHQTDAVIGGSAPHTGVGRHRQVEVTRDLERGLFGECRVAGDIEGELHAQPISTSVNAASNEIGELRSL